MQDNIGVIALGVLALVLMVLYVVDKVYHERTVAALTAAVKDKAADAQLVSLAHRMAVEVIPASVLPQIVDAAKTGGSLIKILTPDDIDALVNAGLDLTVAIATGQPITLNDVVKALAAKTTPASG